MRHFLNSQMLAPNVLTFDIDRRIAAEFANFRHLPGQFSTVRPDDWKSDIEWVSAADEAAFAVFQSAFDRLKVATRIAPYLDVDHEVRLYAGFLVIRSECREPHFHTDWAETNNQAFTFMTPVLDDAGGFGLLYERLDGQISGYEYRPGEAIAFGDNFAHSTKPGRSERPIVLLCFVFGTDKMEHWPEIYRRISRQVTHLRQPDGQFVTAEGKAVNQPDRAVP